MATHHFGQCIFFFTYFIAHNLLRSKHLFIPNFAQVKCGYVLKTEENKPLIESGYEARKENELAVLVEYISREKIEPPEATFLDIILYSREQIILENEAMGSPVIQYP